MVATNDEQDIQAKSEEERYTQEPVGEETEESYPIADFDLVSTPNDFNTRTLVNFIDAKVITIPGFQRNFVWDVKRASRLIESLLVGLPVPQVFLYEADRDSYLVIDGQQRLMSIYYFIKGRFPRQDKRTDLRLMSASQDILQDKILEDNEYFSDFRLQLPESTPGRSNKFHRLQYETLDERYQTSFNLRTIRNVVVRQVGPKGDEAMYEIFNRLNSGGVVLRPQEIRRCMYHSKFYDMLYRTNADKEWRKLVGATVPDIHLKDVEILLRGFAMLVNGQDYRPSMVKFLNQFSQQARAYESDYVEKLHGILESFLENCGHLPSDAFHSTPGRFSPMIFEAVFVAMCEGVFANSEESMGRVDPDKLRKLKEDADFREATLSKTSDTANVKRRLDRARQLLSVA